MSVVNEHDVVVVACGEIFDIDVDAAQGIGYCEGKI